MLDNHASMKVGDIIRGTEWHPGPSYGRDQPLLSVLLPTFRRGKSGLFLKAGRSVLQQKLQELELIIVDDASTDGTADQIAQLMREDPRVSCLRHPQNVGLPAISEYEAFRRARAEHIAFAFDDDEFYPEALGGLLRQATELGKAFVHGYVELHASDGHGGVQKLQDFGRDKTPQSLLRSNNYISNNSVLLHRRVFETVGMYDPHVCMARLCDWDLFRRVAERYDVTRVDVAVGRVLGPSTSDSLGHTYVHESWLSAEWMNTPRDALLLPSTIEDYDVLAAPSSLSRSARLEIEELRPQFRSKFWFPAEAASGRDEPADGHILVVCASLDVSVTLYFDQLPQHYKQRVRIIHYSTWHSGLPEEMVGASAVVFVRALFNFAHWIEQARRLGIPHYYFLDDNLMLLAQEPKYAADYGSYTDDNVREMLSSFSGVLLSTAPLVEYFEQKRLHGRLLLYPPVASRPEDHERGEPAPRDPGVLRVGFFGGGHRAEAFLAEVLPALRALGRRRRVELVTIGLAQGSVLAPELRVVQLEYEHTYDLALRRMMAHGLDVLVHPNSATVNNRYKTQHVLINAHLLGAAPVMRNGSAASPRRAASARPTTPAAPTPRRSTRSSPSTRPRGCCCATCATGGRWARRSPRSRRPRNCARSRSPARCPTGCPRRREACPRSSR
jgi:glycosyltransferase involved in cell wall biosynthesis